MRGVHLIHSQSVDRSLNAGDDEILVVDRYELVHAERTSFWHVDKIVIVERLITSLHDQISLAIILRSGQVR